MLLLYVRIVLDSIEPLEEQRLSVICWMWTAFSAAFPVKSQALCVVISEMAFPDDASDLERRRRRRLAMLTSQMQVCYIKALTT